MEGVAMVWEAGTCVLFWAAVDVIADIAIGLGWNEISGRVWTVLDDDPPLMAYGRDGKRIWRARWGDVVIVSRPLIIDENFAAIPGSYPRAPTSKTLLLLRTCRNSMYNDPPRTTNKCVVVTNHGSHSETIFIALTGFRPCCLCTICEAFI
ncbi:hypothetical protein JB92DRAFT_2205405 [Gautieria morchelliformis]|nr:hypothetical protein JB92DRAFT_2205405 [Gautieria morchelliformis]